MRKVITIDPHKVRELLNSGYRIYWISKWDTSKNYTYCLIK